MAEDHKLNAKEICEVMSNNTCYYKEVFDYTPIMKRKVATWYRHQNKNYVSDPMEILIKMIAGMYGNQQQQAKKR